MEKRNLPYPPSLLGKNPSQANNCASQANMVREELNMFVPANRYNWQNNPIFVPYFRNYQL